MSGIRLVFSHSNQSIGEEHITRCARIGESLRKALPARPHWGKLNPLTKADIEPLYPRLAHFREICRAHDPNGVFQNAYTKVFVGP